MELKRNFCSGQNIIEKLDLKSPEFFNFYVYFSVVVFFMNNFWFKYNYTSWLTGKVSDFTFCFFFPLFLSAICSPLLGKYCFKKRMYIFCAITFFLFFSVKASVYFSDLLNNFVSPISYKIFGFGSKNIPDPSDLIALPFIIFSFFWGVKKNEK